MKLTAIVKTLEKAAPPELAESWDNVGLMAGSTSAEVKKALVCVDLTHAVLDEAVRAKAGLVITHHPVIFKPLKQVTASAAPLVHASIRRGVALYSMHTNFDATPGGTNDALAEALGLTRIRPLQAARGEGECKVVAFVPPDDLSRVSEAAFGAGAGRIGEYFDCAFFAHGIGAFCGGDGAQPTIGERGEHSVAEEVRLEMVAPRGRAAAVVAAIRAAHSYETPAVDVYPLESRPPGCGMGRVGELKRPVTVRTLIRRAKTALGVSKLLVAGEPGRAGDERKANLVSTAAVGAGSGKSLVRDAVAAGASFYLTGEIGHHEAIDAVEAGLTVVAAGHGNSERLAMRRLAEQLDEALSGVWVSFSEADRDPLRVE